MIPDFNSFYNEEEEDADLDQIQEEVFADKTYKIDTVNKRIEGFIDSLDAKKQAILKLLSTEAFTYPPYSENYGRELVEAIGQHPTIAVVMVKDAIKEAILLDDRFEDVIFSDVRINGSSVIASFTVLTAEGETIEIGDENINV